MQAAALGDALAQTASDEMPEPSPLFWDHFSARVSEAVRGESPAPAPPPWMQRFSSPLVAWAAAAAMAVLIMMTVVWRATLHAPSGRARRAGARPDAATPAVDAVQVASAGAGDNIDADEAWAVVRTAAEGLAWEDAHAVGLSAHPGSAEGLALELHCRGTRRARTAARDGNEAERSMDSLMPCRCRRYSCRRVALAAPPQRRRAAAADPLPPEERPNRPAGLSPGEVVAMLDAYAVVQAQDALS